MEGRSLQWFVLLLHFLDIGLGRLEEVASCTVEQDLGRGIESLHGGSSRMEGTVELGNTCCYLVTFAAVGAKPLLRNALARSQPVLGPRWGQVVILVCGLAPLDGAALDSA